MIYSMTGFASKSFSFEGQQFRIELKSLNHRFLELKLRIPRELNALEPALRAQVEKKIKRGSVELWIERQAVAANAGDLQLNVPQATQVYKVLSELREKFKISEGITVRDITAFSDVITKGGGGAIPEGQWEIFQKLVEGEINGALEGLLKMRAHEGEKLKQALLVITGQFKAAHQRLLGQREQIRTRTREKIKKKIEQCFEAYPTADAQMRALMESRIAQEIAIGLERVDIEEELTRYTGHVEQLEKLL